jgi:hypothetical protein
MTDVRQSPPVGQEATPDPAAEARNLLEALRNLAFDAVAQKRERHHTKQHLRRTLKAHFRALEVRINLLAARAATPAS